MKIFLSTASPVYARTVESMVSGGNGIGLTCNTLVIVINVNYKYSLQNHTPDLVVHDKRRTTICWDAKGTYVHVLPGPS